MGEKHMSSVEFFNKLSTLFDSRRKADHGSVFLTQKRLTHGSDLSSPSSPASEDPLADLHPTAPLPILMRATDGNSKSKSKSKIESGAGGAAKFKISTVVKPENLEEFYVRYAEICKVGMQGLKKRDRSGRKKAKAKKRKGPGMAEGEKKV